MAQRPSTPSATQPTQPTHHHHHRHPGSTHSDTSIHGAALSGWQSHQSHGQLTIVFYVDLAVKPEDIHVIIAPTYVIAGIRGYEPVVKATLYARIDATTSYWQLERPPNRHHASHHHHSRSPSRSRTNSGGGTLLSTAAHQAAEPITDRHSGTNRSIGATGTHHHHPRSRPDRAGGSGSGSGSNDSVSSPDQPRHSSPPHSPTNSTGSYELLQRSIASLNTSSSSRDTPPHSDTTTSSGHDPFAPETTSREEPLQRAPLVSAASHTSLRSYEADSSDRYGVTSLQSSQVLGSTASVSQQSSGDPGNELTARLLTVHLTKIDAGMWPLLVSGPAPLDTDGLQADDDGGLSTTQDSITSYGTLRGAISEAAATESITTASPSRPHSDPTQASTADGTASPLRRHHRLSVADSTLSSQSDDSATVLARRRESLSPDDPISDGAKFNMDPVSLALVGYQIRSLAGAGGGAGAGTRGRAGGAGLDEAFEYFVRSWRKVALPVATRMLVQEYLPLVHHEGGSYPARPGDHAASDDSAPPTARPVTASATSHNHHLRPRMIAALGGRTALARLYASYARLSLSTVGEAQRQSSLFPWGSGHTRNPYLPAGPESPMAAFGRASRRLPNNAVSPSLSSPSSNLSSPRLDGYVGDAVEGGQDEVELSEAQLILRFGPLAYLTEAQSLEASIQISSSEWEEAREIAEDARREVEAEAEENQGVEYDEGGSFFVPATGSQGHGAGAGAGSRGRSDLLEGGPAATSPPFSDAEGDPQLRRRKRQDIANSSNNHDTITRQLDSRRRRHRHRREGNRAYPSPLSAAAIDRAKDAAAAAEKRGGVSVGGGDGGLMAFVGSAALLSVFVAGTVTALGWWRRAGGAGGGG